MSGITYPKSDHVTTTDVGDEADNQTFLRPEDARDPRAAELQGAPEEVRELRDEPARKLYGESIARARAALVEKTLPLRDANGNAIPEHIKSTYARFLAEASQDLELSNAEFEILAKLPGARSQQEVFEWERATVEQLRREFGEAELADRVREANALLARDPRVREWAVATGLASHPTFVRLMIDKARSLIAAGKLKKP